MKILKSHFFEMIVEEPMLQAIIASPIEAEPESICELAEEKDLFLSLTSISEKVKDQYNLCMPEHLKIDTDQLFEPLFTAEFKNEFIELKTFQV